MAHNTRMPYVATNEGGLGLSSRTFDLPRHYNMHTHACTHSQHKHTLKPEVPQYWIPSHESTAPIFIIPVPTIPTSTISTHEPLLRGWVSGTPSKRTARGNQCQLAINTLSPYRDPFFLSTSSSSSDSTMNPQSHQNETSFSEREQENIFFLRAPLKWLSLYLSLYRLKTNKLYRFIINAQMAEGCVLTSTDTDTLSRTSCIPGCHGCTSED